MTNKPRRPRRLRVLAISPTAGMNHGCRGDYRQLLLLLLLLPLPVMRKTRKLQDQDQHHKSRSSTD